MLWLLLVLLFLPVLSVSPLSRFTGFPGYVWVAFRVFFDVCIQFVFSSAFGCSFVCFSAFLGGPGEVTGVAFFQLWDVFSAEAGTFDFDRHYNVLAVFSRFGGFQKH